ncbi:hypothetical protein pb186bvf_011623 [Paramecium bursaria]
MTKRVGDYELGKILGQGSFGVVRQATHVISKEEFAIKIIDKEKVKKEDLVESLKKEIQILMIIEHPNIVKLIEVLASKTKIYLVLEWIRGGELFDKIKHSKLSEQQMRIYFRQIIRALQYCQTKQIAHRDLKPENILICENDRIKINDFGLSSLYLDHNYNNELYTTCGTINYLAPEVIQSKGYDGHRADIWSIGVILYFSCAGYLPFEDDNISNLLDSIVNGKYYPFPKHFSKSLQDILSKLLIPQPNKRMRLNEIISHQWFVENITKEEQLWFDIDEPQYTDQSFQLSSYVDIQVDSEFVQLFALKTIGPLEMISFLTGKVATQITNVSKDGSKNFPTCFTSTLPPDQLIAQLVEIFNQQKPLERRIELNQYSSLFYKFRQFSIKLYVFQIKSLNKYLVNIQLIDGSFQSFQDQIKLIWPKIQIQLVCE